MSKKVVHCYERFEDGDALLRLLVELNQPRLSQFIGQLADDRLLFGLAADADSGAPAAVAAAEAVRQGGLRSYIFVTRRPGIDAAFSDSALFGPLDFVVYVGLAGDGFCQLRIASPWDLNTINNDNQEDVSQARYILQLVFDAVLDAVGVVEPFVMGVHSNIAEMLHSHAVCTNDSPAVLYGLDASALSRVRDELYPQLAEKQHEGLELARLEATPDIVKLVLSFTDIPYAPQYIAACLRNSVCFRDTQTKTPVAWGLLHSDMSIGLVTTVEEHRRKGLALRIVAELVLNVLPEYRKVALGSAGCNTDEGAVDTRAFCLIRESNTASINLFNNIFGFTRIGPVHYFDALRKQ
ncbi:hypothetical protein GQ42DRAFT_32515 [Ramicandelaber brevisporus]|nr:hypothetical protein GQ42DRAFT_32515 [Ramicandelaber brevisporus]